MPLKVLKEEHQHLSDTVCPVGMRKAVAVEMSYIPVKDKGAYSLMQLLTLSLLRSVWKLVEDRVV